MGTKGRLVVFLLIIAIGIFVAWNMIPPRFHNSQLQDDLDDIVRRVSYSSFSDDDIKRIVISKAQSEDIVLKEDQITIAKVPAGLAISVHYQVHVDMIVYQTDLDFVANSRNKMIGT
jgi:hypothetical protein